MELSSTEKSFAISSKEPSLKSIASNLLDVLPNQN